MKVLIIKVSSMGDVIHTFPAVTDACSKISNISFDWVIEDTFSEMLKWHPAINKIIPIKLRFWNRKWYKFLSWKEYYQCINQLKDTKYDIIIDAQGLLKTSIFITNIVRGGDKHGMDFKSVREPISCWCYNKRHYIDKGQHAIERIRKLFSVSLKYSIPFNFGQYNIKSYFEKFKKNNIPYLIFLHATTRSVKHWPEHHWSTLIQYAINSGYYVKLPYWGKVQEARVKRLIQDCNYNRIIILSELTLLQIAEQIMQAIAVVSVDTGLSHLAAALERPNLTLYGPTNPELIGTYGKNQVILRAFTKKMKHLPAKCVWETIHNNFSI